MKKLLILALGMVFLLGSGGLLSAQPQATGFTLSDVYYYLTEGIEATEGGHSLQPPEDATPGQTVEGFDKSLVDIYYFMAEVFGEADLTKADLAGKGLKGKKYFSTASEDWGVVEIVASPTPATTPTPQPWYDIYGPNGTNDVVKIGSMYVAKSKDGIGCANDGQKNWSDACSWGTGLNWCDKTDWVLPSKDNLSTICASKDQLTFQSYFYWSSTKYGASSAWPVNFSNCSVNDRDKDYTFYVRAVRGGE